MAARVGAFLDVVRVRVCAGRFAPPVAVPYVGVDGRPDFLLHETYSFVMMARAADVTAG
jgi:hypothetical protein